MFELIFYKDKRGNSDIINYLDALKKEEVTNKHAKINRKKILVYLAALSEYGTRIGKPFVRHIDGNLWELRPLQNRIFFFYWKDNRFILLHHFIKKTKRTPKKEIEKAKNKLKDFLERNGE